MLRSPAEATSIRIFFPNQNAFFYRRNPHKPQYYFFISTSDISSGCNYCNMDETRECARARSALRNHIGALYSCPTDLPVPRVREDNLRELSLKRPDGSTYSFERLRYTPYSSARCLVRQVPVQPRSNCYASSANGDPPSDEPASTSTAAAAPASATTTATAAAETDGVSIAEVFCRVLPLRTLPASTPSSTASGRKLGPAPVSPRHATGADDRNGNTDALLEALGTMYKGYCPQAAIAAGPGTTTRKEAEESVGDAATFPSDAAQPPELARPLVTCARLHAGLVPLYTPLVESGDDVFLVRIAVVAGPISCGVRGYIWSWCTVLKL